jgi:hypothetical protein
MIIDDLASFIERSFTVSDPSTITHSLCDLCHKKGIDRRWCPASKYCLVCHDEVKEILYDLWTDEPRLADYCDLCRNERSSIDLRACVSCMQAPRWQEVCAGSYFCYECHNAHEAIACSIRPANVGVGEKIDCLVCRKEKKFYHSPMGASKRCEFCYQALPKEKTTQTYDAEFSTRNDICKGCVKNITLSICCPYSE